MRMRRATRLIIDPNTYGRDGHATRRRIMAAAEAAGKSLSLWALEHLEQAAKRELEGRQ